MDPGRKGEKGDMFDKPFSGKPGEGPERGRGERDMPSLEGKKNNDFGKILNKAFAGEGDQRGGDQDKDAMMRERGGKRDDGDEQMMSNEGGEDHNGERLRETQRHLGDMERGMKMIKRQMASMAKKKIPVPAEISTLISELEAAIATVRDAKEETDAVETALDVIMDKGEDLRDIGPMLGVLEQWPRMETRVSKRLAAIKKSYLKNKTAAEKAKLDVSDPTADIDATIVRIEAAMAEAKSDFEKGDFENIMENLDQEVFSELDDLQDKVNLLQQSLQASKNGKRALADAKKMIGQFEAQAKRLLTAKKDTTKLDTLIAEMKAKHAQATTLLSSGKITPESMYDLFVDGERLANDAQDEIAHLKGEKTSAEKELELAAPTNGATLIYANVLDLFGL